MRLVSLFLTAALFACGGSSRATTTPTPTPTPAPGTSGYPGLDWGATTAEIRSAYPAVEGSGAELTLRGAHEGMPAIIRLELEQGKLARIAVDFTVRYPSMEECATTWATVRAAIDPDLGPSAADNLAAYWDGATTAVVLACNPDDDDGGDAALSMSYGPPTP